MEEFQEAQEVEIVSKFLEHTQLPSENLDGFQVHQRLMVSFFQVLVTKFSEFLTFTKNFEHFLGQDYFLEELSTDLPDLIDVQFVRIFGLATNSNLDLDLVSR